MNTLPEYTRKFPIIEIENARSNTPKELVDEAIDLKNDRSTPKGDSFWVVYDRESVADISESIHAEAFKKAKDNQINLAISNVCFEVWILLHAKLSNKPFTSYNELARDENFKAYLNSLGIDKYDKGRRSLFELTRKDFDTAIKNARKMNTATKKAAEHGQNKPYQLNPYTDIVELIDAINEFIKKNK